MMLSPRKAPSLCGAAGLKKGDAYREDDEDVRSPRSETEGLVFPPSALRTLAEDQRDPGPQVTESQPKVRLP